MLFIVFYFVMMGFIQIARAQVVLQYAANEAAREIVKAQIENMSTKGADKYLKDLGIDGGMDGLDFSNSNWAGAASGGIPELQVSVAYTINFHLGIIELGPRKFRVCAKTGLW